MGVHGLTTYLRENKRSLSHSVELPIKGGAILVVDGWSFIYELQQHPLLDRAWVYGGEYEDFVKIVQAVVHLWLAVDLKVHFVFDGPYPDLKFPALVSRAAQSTIRPAQLFFNTSAAARITPRNLRESRILPPLSYSACLTALRVISASFPEDLFVHFADEEGDPYTVDLAGRLGAYVTGHDSDFVILNADGYRGYVPMDEMVYGWSLTALDAVPNHVTDTGDDGFQPVRKGKKKVSGLSINPSARAGIGLFPTDLPLNLSDPQGSLPNNLTLSLPVYLPATLAAQLQIPTSLLPLLGALNGNDYTQSETTSRQSFERLFFGSHLTLPQRITHVAATLQSILAGGSNGRRKAQKPVSGAVELIDAAVTKLLVRDPTTLGTGERENIVNKIVDAALQYAIPPRDDGPAIDVSEGCTIHVPAECPLIDTMGGVGGGGHEDAVIREVRRRLLAAYRAGDLSARVMDALSSGTTWPRLFLESPNAECTARSVGRPIREWIYAILDDALGLPSSNNMTIDDSDDELVDVVEIDSEDEVEFNVEAPTPIVGDALSELEAKLERLQAEQRAKRAAGLMSPAITSAGSTRPATALAMASSVYSTSRFSTATGTSVTRGKKVIQEYVRRGTRLAADDVVVPLLGSLLARLPGPADEDDGADVPLLLRDERIRLGVFLRVLSSDTVEMRELTREQLMAAAAVRYVVRRFDDRARQSKGVKDREKERWTRSEIRAFLAAFNWSPCQSGAGSASAEKRPDPSGAGQPPPQGLRPTAPGANETAVATVVPVEDRHAQLIAQVSAALEAAEHLAGVLLLSERVPSPAHLFSGRRFHANLNGIPVERVGLAGSDVGIPERLWKAVITGLEEAAAPEFGKRGKKERRKEKASQTSTSPPTNARATKQPGATRNASMFSALTDMNSD